MAEMTPERWAWTCEYLRDVFGAEDEQLRTLTPRAVAAGLPDIAVSPDVGRFLMILTSMTGGGRGARIAVEVGTLGGYSGIWLARGLAPGGRLITIDPESKHADFAEREFATAGLGSVVQIRRQPGLAVLPELAREFGDGGVDVVFMDALKHEYPQYFEAVRPAIAVGGLVMADNVLGSNRFWIDDPPGQNADRDGADRLNRMLAADPDFEAVAVPLREGLLVARRIK